MFTRLKISFLVTTSPDHIMRIVLSAIIVLLGANLIIDLMDSNLKTIIEERNETINKLIES